MTNNILFSMARRTLALAALAAAPALAAGSSHAASSLVFFGTYTGSGSKGIYASTMDTQTGGLTEPQLVAETDNPSFVALHPSGKYLYAVNEIGNYDGTPWGSVSSFEILDAAGKLKWINTVSSRGGAPCHVVVDKAGKHVLVANYVGGNAAVFPVRADGGLAGASSEVRHTGSGVDKSRQEAPHAHSINLDAANTHAVVADLGLDKVMIYKYDAARGVLTPNEPPFVESNPGGGPRHFDFHPGGAHAFANNEMLSSVMAMRYDKESGALAEIVTLGTLPDQYFGSNSTAQTKVHPSGRFVYVSNRGHDSVAVFSFDAATGAMRQIQVEPTRGKTPRNFNITPDGRFLLAANQNSGSVNLFRIDLETGKLTPTALSLKVPNPVCVEFLPLK